MASVPLVVTAGAVMVVSELVLRVPCAPKGRQDRVMDVLCVIWRGAGQAALYCFRLSFFQRPRASEIGLVIS